MRRSTTRLLAAAATGAGVALAASAAAPSETARATGSAEAFAIRIEVPGAAAAGTETVSAPPDTAAAAGGFAHPADGSILSTAAATASASTAAGSTMRAQASAEIVSLSLFGGEVTATRVTARARARASARAASGDTAGTAVSGLTVLGQPAGAGRVALGDWGYAELSSGSHGPVSARRAAAYRASATALSIHLTAPHAGLPAGTVILVGFAEASARADKLAPPPRPAPPRPAPPPQQQPDTSANPKQEPSPKPTQKAKPTPKRSAGGRRGVLGTPSEPSAERTRPGRPPVRRPPSGVTPRLTPGGYVFPVYGPTSWSDDFAVPSRNPRIGWHHGIDIFAPLGAPVLAVNDGVVFSVGWIPVGGNRLWLEDEQGNQFYYAHLSAFSPLAVNGRTVRAGDVLGFVGNTGDAAGTSFHLHFEIHPARLLRLGYDGVVNPTPYLKAWQRLEDVDVPVRRVRVHVPDPGAWAPPVPSTSRAPTPGAILLQAADISQASGLERRTLKRALIAPAAAESGGGHRG